jgi:L-ribulose-5-phosphate 3-epimerase
LKHDSDQGIESNRSGQRMKRRQMLTGALGLGVVALTGPAWAKTGPRSLGRLSVTTVCFRDWFAQTPAAFRSGRPTSRSMTLSRFPEFVADEFGLGQAELWSLYFEDLSPAYCRDLKRAARKAKVRIANLQLDNIDADLAAVDEPRRMQSLELVRGWMDRAALIGSPRVRVNTDTSVANRPFDADRIADSYRRLAEYGDKVGVDVLIENHTGYSASIKNVVAIYDRVKHRRCKMAADWGNSAAKDTEARIADLSAMFSGLGFVSAKGTRFDAEYRHLPYDISAIVRATEASGYRGIYSVELFAFGKDMPEDPVRAVKSMIDTIAANLRT